jgi:hypothetical protein
VEVDGPTKAVAVVTDAPRRNNFIAENFMFDLIICIGNAPDLCAVNNMERFQDNGVVAFC